MPYFLVLISHVRTLQAYACAYRTSGNQALGVPIGSESGEQRNTHSLKIIRSTPPPPPHLWGPGFVRIVSLNVNALNFIYFADMVL